MQRVLVVSLAAVGVMVGLLLVGQLVLVSSYAGSLAPLIGVALVAAGVTALATWAHRSRRRRSG